MEWSTEEVRRAFSRFITENRELRGLSNEVLAQLANKDVRTVTRYQDPKLLPQSVPDQTYFDFLSALGLKHEDFLKFMAGSGASGAAAADSLGGSGLASGPVHIGNNITNNNNVSNSNNVTNNNNVSNSNNVTNSNNTTNVNNITIGGNARVNNSPIGGTGNITYNIGGKDSGRT